MEQLVVALGEGHISLDRDVKEQGGALKVTVLMEQGAHEGQDFQKEVIDRPGENIGSPHVGVRLKTLHGLLNYEEARSKENLNMHLMELAHRTKTIQATLRKMLNIMGGSVKNGPTPCLKPTRNVKMLLKAFKNADDSWTKG